MTRDFGRQEEKDIIMVEGLDSAWILPKLVATNGSNFESSPSRNVNDSSFGGMRESG